MQETPEHQQANQLDKKCLDDMAKHAKMVQYWWSKTKWDNFGKISADLHRIAWMSKSPCVISVLLLSSGWYQDSIDMSILDCLAQRCDEILTTVKDHHFGLSACNPVCPDKWCWCKDSFSHFSSIIDVKAKVVTACQATI